MTHSDPVPEQPEPTTTPVVTTQPSAPSAPSSPPEPTTTTTTSTTSTTPSTTTPTTTTSVPSSSSSTSSSEVSPSTVSSSTGSLWSIKGLAKIGDLFRTQASEPVYSQEMLTAVKTAVSTAKAAIGSHGGGRPLVLHIGIGVGDPPTSTFSTGDVVGASLNSSPATDGHLTWQVNPSFLRDAMRNYECFVVAFNFNRSDTAHPIVAPPPADGIHLRVDAPFPLGARTKGGNADTVVGLLLELGQAATCVSVLNAVVDKYFVGLSGFLGSCGPKKGKKMCSYLCSYNGGKTAIHEVIAIPWGMRHNIAPTTMEEAFPEVLLKKKSGGTTL